MSPIDLSVLGRTDRCCFHITATQPGVGRTVHAQGDPEVTEVGADTALPSQPQMDPSAFDSGPSARQEERITESPPRESGEAFPSKVPFKERVIGVCSIIISGTDPGG